jgi:hypothetical protein
LDVDSGCECSDLPSMECCTVLNIIMSRMYAAFDFIWGSLMSLY